MGLLDKMKSDIQNVGGNKGKFFYVRDGEKRRIRFLQEIPSGMEVPFHDSFQDNINVPCQKLFGRKCRHCDDQSLRTRSMYIWSVWDYEANEVKLLMYAANKFTPVPTLIAMYETYGTIMDRDYMIQVTGKQKDKVFTVLALDKEKFRNDKAKPMSESAVLKTLDAAYPDPVGDKGGRKDAIDEFNDAVNEPDKEEGGKYDGMDAKALYKMCKERDIEVEPKKPAAYYRNLLEENDKAHEDWDDEEESDDEEWEEE